MRSENEQAKNLIANLNKRNKKAKRLHEAFAEEIVDSTDWHAK